MSRAGPTSAKPPAGRPRAFADDQTDEHEPTTCLTVRPGDLCRDRLTGDVVRVGTIEDGVALCLRPRSRGTITIPLADLTLEYWDLTRRVFATLPDHLGVDLDTVRAIVNATVSELGEVAR